VFLGRRIRRRTLSIPDDATILILRLNNLFCFIKKLNYSYHYSAYHLHYEKIA
jgi:hypothetical protein